MNGHRDEGDKADKAKQEKHAYSQRHRYKKEFRLLLILVGKYSPSRDGTVSWNQVYLQEHYLRAYVCFTFFCLKLSKSIQSLLCRPNPITERVAESQTLTPRLQRGVRTTSETRFDRGETLLGFRGRRRKSHPLPGLVCCFPHGVCQHQALPL